MQVFTILKIVYLLAFSSQLSATHGGESEGLD